METKKIENILLLYVEDDDNIRKVYERYLKRKVSNVITAIDGQDGYDKYIEFKPSLIVTDIKMPRMTGLEMSRKIREVDNDIPIIVTTAHTETEFFQDAINIGVDSFLLKPVDMNKLQKSIKDISENIKLKIKSKELDKIMDEQNKMVALSDLISNISHQWRQPLSAISAASFNIQYQIEAKNYDPELFNKKLKNIGECVQYLSDTIENFRHFINDERALIDFDIIEKIKESLSIESGVISSNNINIVTKLNEKIMIKGFPNEFVQTLINIINNSLDALENKDDVNKIIYIETKVKDDIEIIIADNGNGIDDEIIKSMFEPYTTTKHKSRGVGLGLYLTYRIITEKMNGMISGQNGYTSFDGSTYEGACIKIIFKTQ